MSWKYELEHYGREQAVANRMKSYSTEKFRARKYGVTPEMYEAKLKSQGGVCAICHQPPRGDSRQKSLAVDHDHEYGRLRDLLCVTCNRLLGQADDDPDRLLEAAQYLKKWKMKFLFGDSK